MTIPLGILNLIFLIHIHIHVFNFQEALLKRLGEGAHPFSLTLTAQAPPSVQLVPAKRYYGAPIGTSYDVRCFIGKLNLITNYLNFKLKLLTKRFRFL